MGAVYVIQNLANGKVYVGQTAKNTVLLRYKHAAKLRVDPRQPRLHKAVKSYGVESFQFLDLMKGVPVEGLDAWERFWIKCLGGNDPDEGYNLTSGGLSGKVPSEETRQLMREKGKRSAEKGHYLKGLFRMIERSQANAGKPGPKWTENQWRLNSGPGRKTYRSSVWFHPEHGTFVGCPGELVRKFPEQRLARSHLKSVRSGSYSQHKGWSLTQNRQIYLQLKG